MLVDAVALVVLGTLVALLPLSAGYRAHLVRRLGAQAGTAVPADRSPALEARLARRARASGAGIVLGGLALAVTAALAPAGGEPPSGGFVVVSLAFTFGAGGVAVAEILRPGAVGDGPRTARATAPSVGDYVAPGARVVCGAFTGVGLLALLGTLALTGSQWFAAAPVWASPVPYLAVAIPVVTALSWTARRRVLAAPQPARDETELFWQDALRATTLTSLTVPPALVGLLALTVCGTVLDDAASAAATASGAIGPDWSLWLLVAGYTAPVVLLLGALVLAVRPGGGAEPEHFRTRLWATGPAPSAA